MSCDWSVFCVDCGEDAGFEDCNRQLDEMRAIAAHGPRLITDETAEVLATLTELNVSVTINANYGSSAMLLSWLVRHRGHRLVARNEYGENDGQCEVPEGDQQP